MLHHFRIKHLDRTQYLILVRLRDVLLFDLPGYIGVYLLARELARLDVIVVPDISSDPLTICSTVMTPGSTRARAICAIEQFNNKAALQEVEFRRPARPEGDRSELRIQTWVLFLNTPNFN